MWAVIMTILSIEWNSEGNFSQHVTNRSHEKKVLSFNTLARKINIHLQFRTLNNANMKYCTNTHFMLRFHVKHKKNTNSTYIDLH